MSTPRILSVGQCAADHGTLSRAFKTAFAAEVVAVDTAHEAVAALQRDAFHLVLVNRVFDYDGSSGLDLVRKLKADARLRDVPVMLVSNYADVQEEAVAAGAVPGFGKASVGRPEMLDRVRPFLSDAATSA